MTLHAHDRPHTTAAEDPAADAGPITGPAGAGASAGGVAGAGAIIGWVGDLPIPRSRLNQRIADLRNGPLRAALPAPGSSEDRQLARWLTQVILTESLCESTAAELGLPSEEVPSHRAVAARHRAELSTHGAEMAAHHAEVAPHRAGSQFERPDARRLPCAQTGRDGRHPPPTVLDRVAAVELGSINAAAYNGSVWVRAMFQHVTASVTVPPEWRRPSRELPRPPLHLVQHRLFADRSRADLATPSDLEPLGAVTLDSLPSAIAEAIRRQTYGTIVGPVEDALGWHVAVATPAPVPEEFATPRPTRQEHMPHQPAPALSMSGPFAVGSSVRDRAAPRPETGEHDSPLLESARRRAFARWLDDMRAQKVRLVPGLEHPGDPRQPDNHHKH
ncbi:DUF7158 domain-containing protein [Nonomuraea zeae]|uniref:[acyl-carrier-protein] S-malonyltransferase n=1 Tax=Nonomuraea zeae TaxID=1642303 RepID=A0A5S4GAT5_9ACTN|nr:hypothetical protein [Nonomuraea zeae]TMR29561.1 hypothetical protein ETD85_32070 [Nonomuraea zeae]